MACKAQKSLEITEESTLIQMKNYTESLYFAISPLNHKVILENNWCEEH